MDENQVEVSVETPAEQSYSPEPEVDVVGSAPEADSSQEPQIVASAEEMSIVVDPVTGKRSLQFNEANEEPQAEEQPEPQPQQEAQPQESFSENVDTAQQKLEMPMYNLEEFSNALAGGYVDPSRVPAEYQAQYADYRIKEALAQRQAQQRQAYEQEMIQRQQIAQQMTPDNRAQANKDFFRSLEEEAKAAALRDLQLTQEQLDEAEVSIDGDETKKYYEEALAWHKDRIRNELQARYQQEQAYKAQQQKIYADLDAFVKQERAKEPYFAEIDLQLSTRYKTLPYEQGSVIQAALKNLGAGTLTAQDVAVLEDYYLACRKEFHAEKNGLKPTGAKPVPKKPPVVESAGSGQQTKSAYKPNYSKLRSANVDQRSAWFAEYFKNKGW